MLTQVIIGKLMSVDLAFGFKNAQQEERRLRDSFTALRSLADSRPAWFDLAVYLSNWQGFTNYHSAWQRFTNHRVLFDVPLDVLSRDALGFSDKYLKPIVEQMIEKLESGEDISKKSESPIAGRGAIIEYEGISCRVFWEKTEAGYRIYFDMAKLPPKRQEI